MPKSTILKVLLLAIAATGPALAQGGSRDAEGSPAPATAKEPKTEMPSYNSFNIPEKSSEDARADEAICRDRIHKAREEAGQPPLDRDPATGEEPMALWAVDRREDGCSVLVTMGDADDIRPIPKIEERYALRPAAHRPPENVPKP